MSKEKTVSAASLFQEIFTFAVYKKTQGRIARQVSCGVIWVTFALAAWSLWRQLVTVALPNGMEYALPFGLLLVGLWIGYRAVNVPRFADFLIAVEAEMNKVSWPSQGELVRSSLVVIFVIFALAAVLFSYDLTWQALFRVLGIRQ